MHLKFRKCQSLQVQVDAALFLSLAGPLLLWPLLQEFTYHFLHFFGHNKDHWPLFTKSVHPPAADASEVSPTWAIESRISRSISWEVEKSARVTSGNSEMENTFFLFTCPQLVFAWCGQKTWIERIGSYHWLHLLFYPLSLSLSFSLAFFPFHPHPCHPQSILPCIFTHWCMASATQSTFVLYALYSFMYKHSRSVHQGSPVLAHSQVTYSMVNNTYKLDLKTTAVAVVVTRRHLDPASTLTSID